jgi:hypothetical protein
VGGVHLAQRAGLFGVHHAVQLPAAEADHLVPWLVARVLRLDHLTHRAALHHLAQRLRLRIALAGVHASAHVGVQAQEVVAHQHLAVLQGRGVGGDEPEVGGCGLAFRAVVEQDLFVLGHGVPWLIRF